jgi:hypothetical protein
MKKIIFMFICLLSATFTIAQQLPLGSCGIVCTYDASGNRLRRLYYCNNGGAYPMKGNSVENAKASQNVTNKEEFSEVDALYPNPTTGVFFITFSKILENAQIVITDVKGKVVQKLIGNGIKLTVDLSAVASGVYFVRIEDNGLTIVKKVIKQ